jgi:hypothetical protein
MSKGLKIENGNSGGSSPPAYYREPPLARIDTSSEESLEKWGAILHLGRKDLLSAINEFGPVVRDIRRGLINAKDDKAA